MTYANYESIEKEQPGGLSPIRLAVLAMLVVMAFTRPGLAESTPLMRIVMHGGLWLFVAAVLGRFWCLVYISGRSDKVVVNDGPYTLCRHPLYFFTVLAVIGFGMMIGSVILTAIAALIVGRALATRARQEERFMISEFGETYRYYKQNTPGFLPRLPQLPTSQSPLTVSNVTLRRGLVDVLLLISLIPIAGLLAGVQANGFIPTLPLI